MMGAAQVAHTNLNQVIPKGIHPANSTKSFKSRFSKTSYQNETVTDCTGVNSNVSRGNGAINAELFDAEMHQAVVNNLERSVNANAANADPLTASYRGASTFSSTTAKKNK